VHDKLYVAYDATGRRLRFEVAADERITVTEDPAGVQDPRALEQALRSHLDATRREAPPQASLGELVWIAGSKDLERLRQGSKRSRRRAAWRLGESTDVRAVPSLIDVLDDEDSKLVEAAASALGTLGDRRAVEPLAHLLESRDEWVRLTAATALAEIGDARGEPILVAAMASVDADQPLTAAGALVQLGEGGEAALLRALEDPEQPAHVREAIVKALAGSSSQRARAALEAALEDKNRFVRRAARRALSGSG
jgi:HEAT repeat protein